MIYPKNSNNALNTNLNSALLFLKMWAFSWKMFLGTAGEEKKAEATGPVLRRKGKRPSLTGLDWTY